MAEVNGFAAKIIEVYNGFINQLPEFAKLSINLFLLILVVVVYSVFIWKLYRFIATKNIFGLNLNKYNRSEHPFIAKTLAGILYFIEYILILPFLIFIWFAVFTIFLILLTQNLTVDQILLVSAMIIGAIRVSCYYSEDLAKDLAKLLPFTLLAITILNPNFFDFARIISHISQIPEFFSSIIIYMSFIVILEVILRLFDFIFSLFGLEDVPELPDQKS